MRKKSAALASFGFLRAGLGRRERAGVRTVGEVGEEALHWKAIAIADGSSENA